VGLGDLHRVVVLSESTTYFPDLADRIQATREVVRFIAGGDDHADRKQR